MPRDANGFFTLYDAGDAMILKGTLSFSAAAAARTRVPGATAEMAGANRQRAESCQPMRPEM
jgi:hypothetical protein